VLALVGLLSVLVAPVPAPAQSASSAVRGAASRVVTLRGYDESGALTSQGSGFYLGSGRIATNYHVIAGASQVRIVGGEGRTLSTARYAEAIDARLDLAILPGPEDGPDGLPLELHLPELGDHVWAFGSPKGLNGTMTDGIVSAVRERGGRTVVQISAPISPGSSGGPVLNEGGRVIGVTVSSIRDGQNLNFAVPARELAWLAATNGGRVEFPVGSRAELTAEANDGSRGSAGRHSVSPRWEFIARNASDADLYYDRETMAQRGEKLRVWIYTVYPTPQAAGTAAYDATKALFELRCEDRQFRLNQYLLLRGEKVVGSNGTANGGGWSVAAPDSVAEGLLRSVCATDRS
jgi:hypothetical protein